MRAFHPHKLKPVNPVAHRVLHQIREAQCIHQIGYADLADRSGVTRETIAAWFKNGISARSVSLTNLEAVANVLGLAVVLTSKGNAKQLEMRLGAKIKIVVDEE